MMKKFQLFQIAMVAMVLLGIFGCSKQQERYEDPPWLGGSTIETLEKKGDYTIFLKLMEQANYKIPIEKQLFTLFVPNDASFKTYFQKNGIPSVESLTKDQSVQLFTLHVLRNPRSKFQLIYEYLYNELQGPDGEYAALFFRKPTLSTSIPYQETVKYYPPQKGKTLLMYTGDKLVPLFSKDYFEDFFGAVDGSDYKFMYPGSTWAGNMNWGNAAITESEVRTSNGFVYFIDQVVPPQKSIEEYLKDNQDKYGLYYDILQRFAVYGNTKVDENRRVLYRKSYDLVSNIAEEQGAFTGNEARMKDMFTAYIPSDQVLQEYLNRKIFKSYPTLDSVPKVTLFYILQTQLSRSLGLPSKITKSYFNSFGDPTPISMSDIKSAQMCSNGVFYEMNRVLEPNVFTTVPGNLFFEAKYSTFLYALNQSNLLGGLSNPNEHVTLFAPTNEQIEKYNIRYNSIKAAIEYKGADNLWKNMNLLDLIIFVQDHIYNGRLEDLSGEGYVEMSSKNYIRYSKGEIQACENLRIRDKVIIAETIPNDRNGILYNINNVIKSKYLMGKWLLNDREVSKFKDLLVKVGMLDTRLKDPNTRDSIPNLKFLAEADYWTGLIPTNDAMSKAEAAGEIPTQTEELKKFLLYHFVRRNVIFDDGLKSGEFSSNMIDEVTPTGVKYATLKFTNVLHNLSIEDRKGNVINVDHSKANILVRKGVVHKIPSVLKY